MKIRYFSLISSSSPGHQGMCMIYLLMFATFVGGEIYKVISLLLSKSFWIKIHLQVIIHVYKFFAAWFFLSILVQAIQSFISLVFRQFFCILIVQSFMLLRDASDVRQYCIVQFIPLVLSNITAKPLLLPLYSNSLQGC